MSVGLGVDEAGSVAEEAAERLQLEVALPYRGRHAGTGGAERVRRDREGVRLRRRVLDLLDDRLERGTRVLAGFGGVREELRQRRPDLGDVDAGAFELAEDGDRLLCREVRRREQWPELLHLGEQVVHRCAGRLGDADQVAEQLVGVLEADPELGHLGVDAGDCVADVHVGDAGEVEEQAGGVLELVAGLPEERVDVRDSARDDVGRLGHGPQDVRGLVLEVLEGLTGRAGALDEDVLHLLEVEAGLDERAGQAGSDADAGGLERAERLRRALLELADVLLGLLEFSGEVLRVAGDGDVDGGLRHQRCFFTMLSICRS